MLRFSFLCLVKPFSYTSGDIFTSHNTCDGLVGEHIHCFVLKSSKVPYSIRRVSRCVSHIIARAFHTHTPRQLLSDICRRVASFSLVSPPQSSQFEVFPKETTTAMAKYRCKGASKRKQTKTERQFDVTAFDWTVQFDSSRLLGLPGELRNMIYALALSPDKNEEKGGEVDLLSSRPPSAALLRVCRQTFYETKYFSRQARRRFLNKEVLCINAIKNKVTKHDIFQLRSVLRQARHMHIVTQRSIDNEHRRIDTLWQDGLWHRTETSLNSSMQWFTVVTTGRYSNSETFQDRDAARDYLAQTASRPSVENQIAYFLAVDQKW